MSKLLTQGSPGINPNYSMIKPGQMLVGTDGFVYVKMKETSKSRYRWKLVRRKESYHDVRLRCIQCIAKNEGLKKFGVLCAMVSLPLIGSYSNFVPTLWGPSGRYDYWGFLLLKYLHFHKIDPLELFGIEVELGKKNKEFNRKIDDYIMHKLKTITRLSHGSIILRSFRKVYPDSKLKGIPKNLQMPFICYLLLRYDLVRKEEVFMPIEKINATIRRSCLLSK